MNKIKEIREKFGFTQAVLATKTGLSVRTIQRIEANDLPPKGHTLKVLSEVFEMEPTTLSEKFSPLSSQHKSETAAIQLINLSILSFLGIPFGNIIFPLILWQKNLKSALADEIGRRIINVQIIWSLVLSVMLCLSPFISRKYFHDTQIILHVLFAAYALNVLIVYLTATKLKHNDFNLLDLPIRFL